MTEQERLVYEFLTSGKHTAEEVVGWLTDYHGTDILGEGFAKHLVDEEVCEPSEVGIEPEYEEDDDEDGE